MARIDSLDPLGFRAWHGRAMPMGVEHTHSDVELNLSPAAPLHYRIGGGEATIPAGRLGLLWGAVPHQLVEAGGDADASYWVTVPLDQLLRWDVPAAFIRDLLAGRLLVDRGVNADLDVLLIRQWVADLAVSRGGRPDRNTQLEVEARIGRMARGRGWDASSGRVAAFGSSQGRLDPVEQMARFIVDRHAEPISPADIASEVGWHPNYAMTRFKATTGSTLGTYLTRQRVAHAQRLLVTTRMPLMDIVFEVGFGSPSRFYSAFKTITGQTPASYRCTIQGP